MNHVHKGERQPEADVPGGDLLDLPDTLFDLLPAAVYVCDRSGAILRYNRRAAELWGREPRLNDLRERFCGSYRLYRPDGGPLPHSRCPVADVLSTGIPARDQEVVIERPDGSRIVALVNIDALKDERGNVVGAVNCFQDITERKRIVQEPAVEAGLRDNERRSRALLDALPAAVYTTDANGRITYYNPAAAELAGREPTLGSDEWCVTWKLYWPDGRPMRHDECPMAVALKEDRIVRGGEAIAERPDGTRVPFIPYPTPLHDETGVLIGAVNMLVDITERKRADAALRESEARFRGIVGQVTAGIAETDLTGRFVHVNERYCDIVGYTQAELCRMRMQDITHPEDLPHNAEQFQKLVLTGADFVVEKRYIRKDGAIVWVNNSVSAIRNALGEVTNVVAVSIDVTERKHAETALRRQTQRFETLNRIAKTLSKDLDLERIVQTVTDSATELSGAKFGAFFYNVTDDQGERYVLYTLSGAARSAFENFGLPRNTAVFEPTFRGIGITRSDDIRADPRYGRSAPHFGMPEGHLPVVSYLAVPVVSRSGTVHGGLFFGHDEAGMFTQETEDIVAGIAAHAAIAMDNAELFKAAQTEIARRQNAEEQQNLLLREMSHRVKNLFAVTSGVVNMSARYADTPQEMADALQRRLMALTSAHELIRPAISEAGEARYPDSTLDALVRAIFEPYIDAQRTDGRQSLIARGPAVVVGGSTATSLALVLHELATNAAKYGALSSATGTVEITWSIQADDFHLTWTERGGPPVDGPPGHEGFGSLLARRSIEGQLGGRILHVWGRDGLDLTLSMPAKHFGAQE
ncbi:MAG: PAS domain S-box protein [Shinella sp.]|nr:PAS domain S-box protein [Shinella sp.]